MKQLKLDIIIPSKNRIKKLKNCIVSIYESITNLDNVETNITVYVDNDEEKEIINKKINNIYNTEPILLLGIKININIEILKEPYKAPRFWNNYLKNMEADVLCYLNDDTRLDINCLKNGLEELSSLNYDGVVGFYQSNQLGTTNCGAAFGLIGSKFADRFPDRKVFCPDYYCLYIDEELMKYASSINRFIGSTKATLEHYHPVFTKEKPDETHIWLRRNKQKDIRTYNLRKAKNLLWGKTFEEVNHE